MRLRSLSLDLFGHFAGKSYDFGAALQGAPDFHIIYGPNEAGKTTTMEAYLRLLYGFDARESYDFQHQRKNLRVSGRFETAQGDLALTRLPTRNASLQDAHGTPLPEAAIAAHLGGLGADDYRKLLCLDDDTIERGGDEIANSQGDIGRLLFSAAAGVSDLTAVLDGVDAQANALFLKRSSKSEMAQLKKELSEIAAQIKAQDVPAAAFRKLRQSLAAACQAEEQTSTERNACMLQLSQIKSMQTALPLMHKLAQCDAALAAMPDYPAQLDIGPDDLQQLVSAQSQAMHDITRLEADHAAQTAALAQIHICPDQLGLSQQLADLDAARSRHATAQLDLARRIDAVETVDKDMQTIAAALGATCDPALLVVTSAALAELETARDSLRATLRDRETAADELAQISDKIAQAKSGAGPHPEPADMAIAGILDSFGIDTFTPAYATARQAIDSARSALAKALAALSINGQNFASPPTGAPETTITALAQAHAEHSRKIAESTDALDQMRADHAALAAQIAGLRDNSAIIDDTTAQAITARRDAAWQAHRAALSDATADAFETALQKTDSTAAQRLTQASDLGLLRQLSQSLAQTAARLDHHAKRHQRLAAEQAEITAQLGAIAVELGLSDTPPPATFAQWAQRRTQAETAAQTLWLAEQDHAVTCEKAERLTQALGAHIAQESPDFDALVIRARQRAKTALDQDAAQRASQKALAVLQADQLRRQEQYAALDRAAQAAQTAWADLVHSHLQDHVQADRLMLSFAPLRSLRELDTRRSMAARQVATMQDDQAQFAALVAPLAAQHAVAADDPLVAFAALRQLADDASEQETKRAALQNKTAETNHEIAQAKREIDSIARQVTDLGTRFAAQIPSDTIDALRSAVLGTHAAIATRKERTELAAQILLQLGIDDLDHARTRLEGQTAAGLAAGAMQAQTDLDAIEQDYRAAIATRAEAARDLGAVTGDDSIAALTERKVTLELAMQDTALRYISLRTGHMLAQEAIRRYRDKHRSAMMHATQTAFSELTNGAYSALQTQNLGSHETLVGIDANGRAKHAQDMSKGTRFQLYLALRAAAYEQLADQGTCLPFFCDDIFETFDEARTASACRLMARIGRRGQAIYLTHHQHVVDIARATCGDAVQFHEI
ncbi:Uncharacterized protein YhaN [Yoonia tamlensis]|uniref:Uncharacterized protein YhaN n=1 Tax=Yoonia tamlensis TaxID=390270 RepID=A0A1I6FQI7_9RHOB|nr:YhaN family protein [Yoonia tamlensis]SFR32213.1 Uncharacterized protein YhaN [Yoonia tamlensis]